MVIGKYEDDKEYEVVATIIVSGGMNTAIADAKVPGRFIKELESVMKDISDYINNRND